MPKGVPVQVRFSATKRTTFCSPFLFTKSLFIYTLVSMTHNLTKGSILSNILYFSLPYFASYFLQTLYGLADLYIAGQYNGADVISAVAIGSQIMHMVTVIIVGLAMGSTVLISRSVGAQNQKAIAQLIGNTVVLFTAVALILTAVLTLCTAQIVTLMSTPAEAVNETKHYLSVCFAGIPFIVAYNVISSVLRGMGDSKSPMIFIAVACTLNIVLDYIFMGTFNLGSYGAAWATVIAQSISVLIALIAIKKFNLLVKLRKADFKPDSILQSKMLGIGAPIAVQDGFIQISFLLITVIANNRGVKVAAAVGIVEKIISFLFLFPSSMLSTASTLASQNIGAQEFDRSKKALRYCSCIAIAIGLFFGIVFQFAAQKFLTFFTDDAEVVELGTQYLKTYVFDCALAGIHFPFSGFFSAYGMSALSFIHNAISIILVRIPGAYGASKLFPQTLYAMGIAAPAGSLLSSVICILFYVYKNRKGKFNTIR